MDCMETIRKRQSIRKFKKGEVTQDALLKILEAGRLAPSGKNSQNWHFLVIRNRELMEKIAAAIVAKNDGSPSIPSQPSTSYFKGIRECRASAPPSKT
jgi:nitroreductase